MIKPQVLLDHMRRYWPFVRAIAELSAESASFERDHLLRIAARELPGLKPDERRAVLSKMVDGGLLQTAIGDGGYELHPAALEFARVLLNEHALGPVGVIQAYIEPLGKATDQLRLGLARASFDRDVREAHSRLLELAQQIRNRVDNDYQAILGVIDKVKSADGDMPLSDRYDMVLSAYEDYLTPMKAIISIEGDFNRYLLSAHAALEEAAAAARRANATPGLDRRLGTTAHMLRRLPGRVRETMGRAGQLLRPLVDQARRHSDMARCVGMLLGEVRKRGAHHALPPASLPGFMRTRQYTIRLGLGLDALVARVQSADRSPKSFPDLAPRSTPAEALPRIPARRVQSDLRGETAPVQDLLAWLHSAYPDIGPKATLRIYLDLLRSVPPPRPTGPRQVLTIGSVRLSYTPHGRSMETA